MTRVCLIAAAAAAVAVSNLVQTVEGRPWRSRGQGCQAIPANHTVAPASVAAPSLNAGGSAPVGEPGRNEDGVIVSCAENGVVAMVWHDGPHYEFTPVVLEAAEKFGIKVSFSVNGNAIDEDDGRNRTVLKQAFDAGHQIVNHGYTHDSPTEMDAPALRNHIDRAERNIHSTLGVIPQFYRPPTAQTTPALESLYTRLSLIHTKFSHDALDWPATRTTDDILADYRNATAHWDPSSESYITLQHDGKYNKTHRIAAEIFETVQATGMRFVTLAECVGVEAYKDEFSFDGVEDAEVAGILDGSAEAGVQEAADTGKGAAAGAPDATGSA